MGDETDRKILDMMAVLDADLKGLHENPVREERRGNAFLRPEILVAIIFPLIALGISMSTMYSNISVKFALLEASTKQCKAFRMEDKKYHNLMETRILGLDDEIHKAENGVNDLASEHANVFRSVTRRLRELEKKVAPNK